MTALIPAAHHAYWAAAAVLFAAAAAVWLTGGRARSGPRTSRFATALDRARGTGLPQAEQRARRYTLLAACLFAAVVWLTSGVPIAALAAAALVPAGRWLITLGAAETRAIERLEAVGDWTARLKDLTATGAGLQQAIVDSAEYAPEAISGPLREMAARIDSGTRPQDALTDFAEAIADPECDAVVAQLILQLSTPSRQLRRVLAALSTGIGKQVAQRREIDAERSGARTEIKVLVWGLLGGAAFALLFMRSWVAPFAHGTGLIVFCCTAAAFAAVLHWMARLNRPAQRPRLLESAREQP